MGKSNEGSILFSVLWTVAGVMLMLSTPPAGVTQGEQYIGGLLCLVLSHLVDPPNPRREKE